jgi:Circadian oscillating protein COP23
MEACLISQKLIRIAKNSTLVFLSVFSTVAITYQTSEAANQDFFCDTYGGVPVTYANYQDGLRRPMIRWYESLSSGKTPLQRCKEVSRRFQINKDNGNLRTIINGKINNYPVICAAKNSFDSCTRETLLFTLRHRDNPKDVLRRLLDPNAFEKGLILNQSSNSSQVVIDFQTYLNNLKPEKPDSR